MNQTEFNMRSRVDTEHYCNFYALQVPREYTKPWIMQAGLDFKQTDLTPINEMQQNSINTSSISFLQDYTRPQYQGSQVSEFREDNDDSMTNLLSMLYETDEMPNDAYKEYTSTTKIPSDNWESRIYQQPYSTDIPCQQTVADLQTKSNLSDCISKVYCDLDKITADPEPFYMLSSDQKPVIPEPYEHEHDIHADDGYSSGSGHDEASYPPPLNYQGTRTTGDLNETNTDDSDRHADQQRSSFWQYNSQHKGPRGQKFNLAVNRDWNDPHKLAQFMDPVFDQEQRVHINHVGKARKGDGTDITSNPRKLTEIGKELENLNATMAELSKSTQPRARREKNRLSSKVCRLKKKANNEANKVKLALLRKEHEELNEVIAKIKALINSKDPCLRTTGLSHHVRSIRTTTYRTQAAGRMSESVDKVIGDIKKTA